MRDCAICKVNDGSLKRVSVCCVVFLLYASTQDFTTSDGMAGFYDSKIGARGRREGPSLPSFARVARKQLLSIAGTHPALAWYSPLSKRPAKERPAFAWY